jgi:hypothetical protein
MYAACSALLGAPVVGIRNPGRYYTNVAAHFDVGPEIEREQTQVVEELGHTLAISPHSTLFVLRDTYGVDTLTPGKSCGQVRTGAQF